MAVSGGFNPHTLPPNYEDNNSPGLMMTEGIFLLTDYESVCPALMIVIS